MFGVSSTEMMILFVVALLLFGKRLPEVARSLGKGMMEFKKGLYDIQDEVTSASNNRSSSSQSRPIPADEREEATAPKFEPPKYEPSEVSSERPAQLDRGWFEQARRLFDVATPPPEQARRLLYEAQPSRLCRSQNRRSA